MIVFTRDDGEPIGAGRIGASTWSQGDDETLCLDTPQNNYGVRKGGSLRTPHVG
jgi:hypothetical protein